MMVSVSIFSIVMVMAVGALLSIVDANRKAQGQQNTFDNLDSVLENMSRNIRVGTYYRCIPGAYSNASIETPQDCLSPGGAAFAFESNVGASGNPNDQIIYRLNGTQIERSVNGGTTFVPMTSPEIIIDGLTFYVRGSSPLPNTLQSTVVISLYGHVGTNAKTRVDFNLQTTITQRLFDI